MEYRLLQWKYVTVSEKSGMGIKVYEAWVVYLPR